MCRVVAAPLIGLPVLHGSDFVSVGDQSNVRTGSNTEKRDTRLDVPVETSLRSARCQVRLGHLPFTALRYSSAAVTASMSLVILATGPPFAPVTSRRSGA